MFCDLEANWNILQGWYIFTYAVHAKDISLHVENNYLVLFEYTDFHISINPFTVNPYIGKCAVSTFLSKVPDSDELSTGLMPNNMETNIFTLISIITLTNVLNLFYTLQL